MNLKTVLINRKTFPGSQSIEYLFSNLYQKWREKGLAIESKQLPYYSKGLINRILNTLYLLKYRNHIVHITGDVYYAILGAILCKRIITIHDLSFLERSNGLARKILKLFWIILPVKFSHKVTVVSHATKDAVLKEVPEAEHKIEIIYNFVDEGFKPIERTFNTQNPRILQIGTAFNKNIQRLCEALEGISCILIIIGELSESQRKKIRKHRIIYENRYNLNQKELIHEYEKADLLAFVSTVEGFGMPIIEAQACGLPVVTSNISSMPEIASDGAILVSPYDIDIIRKGILKLISNEELRSSLVKAGYKNAVLYSKEKIAEQYLEVYQSLA